MTLSQQESLSNLLNKSKRSIYFWRTNPENNEKQLRQELQIRPKEEDNRSVLGIQNGLNWMQSFNIGTIMHMQPIQYEEFCLCGGMVYELQRKLLLEKVIYMSIAYFTIATEMRFIQMESNAKAVPDKQS